MSPIAAIPTMYNGVQFRSRLEARWAAFFDLCGWQWEYEPFDLNGWIPDFRTMHADGGGLALWEIKPTSEIDTTATDKIDAVTGKQDSNYTTHLGGFGPKCMWYFTAWSGSWSSYAPDDRLMSTLDALWKEAGNITQWKSSKPHQHGHKRSIAKFPNFRLYEYVDPTETYKWEIDYYRSTSQWLLEWATKIEQDGFSRRAISDRIDSEVYAAVADYLAKQELAGIPLKTAKQYAFAVKFEERAKRFFGRSAALKSGCESIYYAGIGKSAREKANALRAKVENHANFERMNADAEELYRAASLAFFKTDAGRPERVRELLLSVEQYETNLQNYGPRSRVIERLRKVEAELDEIEPSWCCAS